MGLGPNFLFWIDLLDILFICLTFAVYALSHLSSINQKDRPEAAFRFLQGTYLLTIGPQSPVYSLQYKI